MNGIPSLTERELFELIDGLISIYPAYTFEDFLEMEAPLFMKILQTAEKRAKSMMVEDTSDFEESSSDQKKGSPDEASLKALLATYGVDPTKAENKNYKLDFKNLIMHRRK